MSFVADLVCRVLDPGCWRWLMHRGRITPDGPVEQVLLDPQHDYTKTLLRVVPSRLGSR